MSNPNPKNPGHSVFQRLLNLAKENREDFNLLLSRYAMERFLYRLSISPKHERFILKGASLFLVWKGQNYRVTRDADFLAFGSPDMETPLAFTPDFFSDDMKQVQWNAFVRKANPEMLPPSLNETIQSIQQFLDPVINAVLGGEKFTSIWTVADGWSI